MMMDHKTYLAKQHTRVHPSYKVKIRTANENDCQFLFLEKKEGRSNTLQQLDHIVRDCK